MIGCFQTDRDSSGGFMESTDSVDDGLDGQYFVAEPRRVPEMDGSLILDVPWMLSSSC